MIENIHSEVGGTPPKFDQAVYDNIVTTLEDTVPLRCQGCKTAEFAAHNPAAAVAMGKVTLEEELERVSKFFKRCPGGDPQYPDSSGSQVVNCGLEDQRKA